MMKLVKLRLRTNVVSFHVRFVILPAELRITLIVTLLI